MYTQIHAKIHESHSSIVSKSTLSQWIRFLVISVLFSFQCLTSALNWNSSVAIIWGAFPYPLIKKRNYLEPMAVTECQKTWSTHSSKFA